MYDRRSKKWVHSYTSRGQFSGVFHPSGACEIKVTLTRYVCMLLLGTKIKLTPTWFEHAAFWSGVRRATIAPQSQLMGSEIKKWVWYSRINTLLMPGDFDAYLRSPPRWGFNVLSFTAEASVIGSEEERKRMLIGGRGGIGPQRETL